MKEITDNLESLDEKREFVSSKINALNSELVLLSPDDIEALNFNEV